MRIAEQKLSLIRQIDQLLEAELLELEKIIAALPSNKKQQKMAIRLHERLGYFNGGRFQCAATRF